MATRFYLQSTGTPAISPSFGAQWDVTGEAVRLPMSPTKAGTGSVTLGASENSGTVLNLLLAQFIGPVMPPQALSGTFSASIKCRESSTAANQSLQVTVRAVDATTGAELAVLYAGHAVATNSTADALGQEFNNATHDTRLIPAGTALSSHTPAVQFRLVIGIGARAGGAAGTSYQAQQIFRDDQASDLPLTASDTSTANPWVEFSQTMSFDVTAPTAPTDLTLVDKDTESVEFSWTQGTDAVGVTQNRAYVDGVAHGAAFAAATSTTVTGLDPATEYDLTVTALDAVGNESAQSAALTVTTDSDGTPSTHSGSLQEELNRLAGTDSLAETAAANAWAGVDGYALVGALNVKAGLARSDWLDLQGVCNYLSGTEGLAAPEALARYGA